MKRVHLTALFAAAVVLPFVAGTAALSLQSAQQAQTVILVRHAEKAAAPADDPPLTPLGVERAKALEKSLAGAGVTAIISTEFKRTRETIAPIAQKLGITPEIVNARGLAGAAHIAAVAAAVQKHPQDVVLVVGHSNTIPAIIAALGGEKMADICDADYGNLFILTRTTPAARLVKARYGAADKSMLSPGTCATMRD